MNLDDPTKVLEEDSEAPTQYFLSRKIKLHTKGWKMSRTEVLVAIINQTKQRKKEHDSQQEETE